MMQIRHACISTQLRAIGSISRADRDGRLYLLVGDTVVQAAQYMHCVSPEVYASKMHPHKLYSSLGCVSRCTAQWTYWTFERCRSTRFGPKHGGHTRLFNPFTNRPDIDRSVPTGGGVSHSRSLLAISGGSAPFWLIPTPPQHHHHICSRHFSVAVCFDFRPVVATHPFWTKVKGVWTSSDPMPALNPRSIHVTAQFTSRPNVPVLHFVPNIPFGTVLCTKCNKFGTVAVATPTRRRRVCEFFTYLPESEHSQTKGANTLVHGRYVANPVLHCACSLEVFP
jgi:hypothetical protein